MKVINIFSGPGVGKSTTASGLFYFMKKNGLSCEYVAEYAKDLVWEKRFEFLEHNTLSILAEQHRRIDRLQGQVEYAITDSPILLAAVYAKKFQSKNNDLGANGLYHYSCLTLELFNKFDNDNYFLMHTKKTPYRREGRLQDSEEAMMIDESIFDYLIEHKIKFQILEGNEEENLQEIWQKIP